MPFHDLGFSVIALTLLIRGLMFPISHKMIRTQQVMKKIEPHVKEIRDSKKNKDEQAQAMMELYRQHGINPFSGFFAILLQFPVLIALYHVFFRGIPFNPAEVYSFITIPENINVMFLGTISLTSPNLVLAFLAALSQFFQAKLSMPPDPSKKNATDLASAMQKQLPYILPVMIFIFGLKMPAAVALYWTAMNVFAIVHEAAVRKQALRRDAASNERH
ncbi:membrane protein insertase YidC [Candidatus Giovannonibacteria bacterium]|nr:membrane protein insertase YidC [Candidatus Giovannonibacteria bacterium]